MDKNIQNQGSWQWEILLSNHRPLGCSGFLSRSAKYLHRQNYFIVKEISKAAVAHRNRKVGFSRGASRRRMNSYFCPVTSVLAPVSGHASSMVEHLMRLTKTWHVALKHSSWWLDKMGHSENHKKLPPHCCIKLPYSAYYFLINHTLWSPHTGAYADAESNRRACYYWANWQQRSIFLGRIAAGESSFLPPAFRSQAALATCPFSSQSWTG